MSYGHILINIQKQNTPLTQLKYYTSSQKARKLTGVLYDRLLYYSAIGCSTAAQGSLKIIRKMK